ncbi:hypothetical protein JJB99_12675 [Bradyrhizobium diazoefficiens]|nr:hypothetical protein JJB99_12675 [Bradyrhizobium diazoefficiens]
MLHRIPAVKWAFTRLRPSSRSGSIDVSPSTATDLPAILAGVAEAAPALDSSISAEPRQSDITVTPPIARDEPAIAVIVESPSAAPTDISIGDGPSRATPVEIEPVVAQPVVLEQALPVDVASEQVSAPEVVSNDPPVELLTSVEAAIVEEAPVSFEVASEPADAPEAVVSATDASCEECADDKVSDVSESSIDRDLSPSVVLEIEPVLESPAPVVPRAPKVRSKVTEPADRAALIRQRWAETGIRMWNPRLHGTGDATLNIQGRVGLLPPAPGETMPRYDKLEFGMLGGQIVCEGVIVEAPVQADKRSFTHLAAPGKPERVREPIRERQAALA